MLTGRLYLEVTDTFSLIFGRVAEALPRQTCWLAKPCILLLLLLYNSPGQKGKNTKKQFCDNSVWLHKTAVTSLLQEDVLKTSACGSACSESILTCAKL